RVDADEDARSRASGRGARRAAAGRLSSALLVVVRVRFPGVLRGARDLLADDHAAGVFVLLTPALPPAASPDGSPCPGRTSFDGMRFAPSRAGASCGRGPFLCVGGRSTLQTKTSIPDRRPSGR